MKTKKYISGVRYQEYIQAKRNCEAILRDIEKGLLPVNHPALEINKKKMDTAKKELEKLGVLVPLNLIIFGGHIGV